MKGTEKQIKYATDLINDRIKWNKTEAAQVETLTKEVKIFTKATGEYAYSIWFTNDFNEIYSSKEDCKLNKENCKDDFFFHCFKNGEYVKSVDGDCGFACPKREMSKFDTITEHGPDCDIVFLKNFSDTEIEKYLNNNLDDDYCLESDLVVETQEVVETQVEVIETQVEVVEVAEAQNNVEDSDMTQDRVTQDTDQLYFPTIQAFLEATDNIEECENGDLVFTIKGAKYINTHKDVCKKYSANNMFSGSYVFVENIDVVVGQETYPMIEIEVTSSDKPSQNDFVDFENWTQFYQKGFDNAVRFSYIPDMEKKDDIISYYKGYSDGRRFKEALQNRTH